MISRAAAEPVTDATTASLSRILFACVCLLLALLFGHNVYSQNQGFPERSSIVLLDRNNNELTIGHVNFKPLDADKAAISVDIASDQFTDHFLSMRPFRCLQGEMEWFCYLEYPYSLQQVVSTDDLSDLEYQLMFIRKTPSEFGIDAWNGLYYKLGFDESGLIRGELFEGDLNVLQSPPAEDDAKPVDLLEFIEADKSKRLFPALVLKPQAP